MVALLVVVIVAFLATSVSQDYMVLSRRVDNQLNSSQIESYFSGVEAIARDALLKDWLLGQSMDYANELWGEPLALQLPEGKITACMIDLQGRINLNSLASSAKGDPSSDQLRFIRLLQVIPLEDPLNLSQSVEIANAVFDWIDPDDDVRYPGGAEDLYYYQQSPPGKAANQRFFSVSELKMVKGVTEEIYQALTPYVTVWGNGFLNINSIDPTLERENNVVNVGLLTEQSLPVVMRTLNVEEDLNPLSEEMARSMIEQRINMGGFQELDTIFTGPLSALAETEAGLGVSSGYFVLMAQMEGSQRNYYQSSVIRRFQNEIGIPQVRVLHRDSRQLSKEIHEYCIH